MVKVKQGCRRREAGPRGWEQRQRLELAVVEVCSVNAVRVPVDAPTVVVVVVAVAGAVGDDVIDDVFVTEGPSDAIFRPSAEIAPKHAAIV